MGWRDWIELESVDDRIARIRREKAAEQEKYPDRRKSWGGLILIGIIVALVVLRSWGWDVIGQDSADYQEASEAWGDDSR